MAVARKSAVSPTSTLFRQDSALPRSRRGAARRRARAQIASTLASQNAPVSYVRNRTTRRNFPVSPLGEVAKPTPVRDWGKQPPENSKDKASNNIPNVSAVRSEPMWLLRLYSLNRYSSLATFAVVAITLFVYGWTVYSQEIWGQAYQRLQNLQRHERQLAETNAALSSNIADKAEQPDAGLVPATPENKIFLSPAPDQPISKFKPNLPIQEQTPSPLGY
jgi:hypothetical protein